MKKADANMWWIIIGAVIALVVLIVLMVIFTSKTQPLEQGLSDCEGKGGVCTSTGKCPDNTLRASTFDCPSGKCCIGSPKRCPPRGREECGEHYTCTDGYCYTT